MMKFLTFFFIATMLLRSQELIVVADKSFEDQNLSVEEIKDIFLNKQNFINNKKILVMNREFNSPLRQCFEKNILKKSRRSLERYWQKLYYKGKHPPKVVKSSKMLLSYLEQIEPSIGYIDANLSLEKELVVLYKVSCK